MLLGGGPSSNTSLAELAANQSATPSSDFGLTSLATLADKSDFMTLPSLASLTEDVSSQVQTTEVDLSSLMSDISSFSLLSLSTLPEPPQEEARKKEKERRSLLPPTVTPSLADLANEHAASESGPTTPKPLPLNEMIHRRNDSSVLSSPSRFAYVLCARLRSFDSVPSLRDFYPSSIDADDIKPFDFSTLSPDDVALRNQAQAFGHKQTALQAKRTKQTS